MTGNLFSMLLRHVPLFYWFIVIAKTYINAKRRSTDFWAQLPKYLSCDGINFALFKKGSRIHSLWHHSFDMTFNFRISKNLEDCSSNFPKFLKSPFPIWIDLILLHLFSLDLFCYINEYLDACNFWGKCALLIRVCKFSHLTK